jgi:hypothetical protein
MRTINFFLTAALVASNAAGCSQDERINVTKLILTDLGHMPRQ